MSKGGPGALDAFLAGLTETVAATPHPTAPPVKTLGAELEAADAACEEKMRAHVASLNRSSKKPRPSTRPRTMVPRSNKTTPTRTQQRAGTCNVPPTSAFIAHACLCHYLTLGADRSVCPAPYEALQGYLAHKKTLAPLGPPRDSHHRPTVGS
jgi:hypothetical protein